MEQRWVAVTIALGVLILPSVAFADLVWPALILEVRLLGWPSILAGLLVEGAVLVRGFGMPVRRAAIASLAMNGASSVLGIVLVPLVGTIWEVFPGLVLYKVFGIGTCNPGTWVATFVLAVFANTIVELAVLRLWVVSQSRTSHS